MARGFIKKAISGFYYVESAGVLYQCRARGKFRKSGQEPLVGDQVEVEIATGEADSTVLSILPRKNHLVRPPLANIDRLLLVSAFSNPAPNTLLIDQLIAMAEQKQIEPVLVFNKCDQGDFSAWSKIYRQAGFRTFVVSCLTGEGIDTLREELQQGISVFTGNSGVGKSSLLNAMFPALQLPTGDVSEKLGRGRHTTRHVELFDLPGGGYVADTPGFAALDLERVTPILKEDLPDAFREFAPYLGQCRFTSCAHIGEKGCAVAAAVARGKIPRSRYESYLHLYELVKDVKPWMQK